ncbi:MAG: maleate cis-trans isomerase family protein [Rhodospirillaceae bacterium]|jgi:maleate isomerase
MISHDRDYGAHGRVGVALPQANPTVEPEIWAFMPAHTSVLASRLTSTEVEPKDRYREYFTGLENTLATYDTLKLDVCGFACTASTYLIGREEEDKELNRLSDLKGYPVLSAGLAIERALKALKVEKLAIGAPYPEWSVEMSRDYWIGRGFDVVNTTRIAIASDDTRAIYELSAKDALATLSSIDFSAADAILLTGTGMPSLVAIIELMKSTGKPVVSSNLCLSWAMRLVLGLADEGSPGDAPRHPLLNGWQGRIGAL